MAETLTFATFRPGIDEINEIGVVEGHPGVREDLRSAFGLKVDATLKDMVAAIAPHPELQRNIDHGVEVLSRPEVQGRLGYAQATSPFEVAAKLCTRVGLQDTVARSFFSGEPLVEKFDAAIIPDRVPNWVKRMADVAIEQAEHVERGITIDRVTAVSAGKNSASLAIMKQTVLFDMDGNAKIGVTELLNSADKSGRGVMRTAARHLDGQIDLSKAKILLPNVAGNWMQAGVQALEALREFAPDFDTDSENPQLYVLAKHFPLGTTGEEPKTTHQNPISALGNVARGFVLLDGVCR